LSKPSALSFLDVTAATFEAAALELFAVQYKEVDVYKKFCNALNRTPDQVKKWTDIPFLPIDFFKSHRIIRGLQKPACVFESSGTTGQEPSRHWVIDPEIYRASFRKTFEIFYGNMADYAVVALLPSYLERKNASLVFMVEDWIKNSRHPKSGFYLYNHQDLYKILLNLIDSKQKTLFIGVTFALLDFADQYTLPKNEIVLMETGGMKGRGKEPVRSEVHQRLQNRLGVKAVHSEYGMTELFSQAYSKDNGIFTCPPWMKILIREPEDPLSYLTDNKIGGINLIDLANVNSCAFIATQDLGLKHADGSFEVLGRFDHSDVRGCSLMVN